MLFFWRGHQTKDSNIPGSLCPVPGCLSKSIAEVRPFPPSKLPIVVDFCQPGRTSGNLLFPFPSILELLFLAWQVIWPSIVGGIVHI